MSIFSPKQLIQGLLLVLVVVSCSSPLLAAQVTWSGLGDGVSWGQGANWVGGNVPGTSDDVIITGDTVIFSDQDIVKNLVVNNGHLTISDQSSLTVRDAALNGVSLINSTLEVVGVFNIRNHGAIGLYIGMGCTVTITGTLGIIGNGSPNGVTSFGQLNNNGMISITNVEVAIAQSGFLDNAGVLNITNFREKGLHHIDGSFFNSAGNIMIKGDTLYPAQGLKIEDIAAFFNFSLLEISDCRDDGIRSVGTIENYSNIIISGVNRAVEIIGGLFYNDGTVDISADAGLNRLGFGNNARVDNLGIIRSQGLSTTSVANHQGGHFTNSGSILIDDQSSGDGLSNSGIFINESTGVVDIMGVEDLAFGLSSLDTFVNKGLIDISMPFEAETGMSLGEGLYSINAVFRNQGSINIMGARRSLSVGRTPTSQSRFYNEEGADINLEDAVFLTLEVGDTFYNDGDIDVINSGFYGIIIGGTAITDYEASFYNNGSITAMNAPEVLIVNNGSIVESVGSLTLAQGGTGCIVAVSSYLKIESAGSLDIVDCDTPLNVIVGGDLEINGQLEIRD